MRSVILNSQTIVTTGRSRQVLKSGEGVARAMGLREMRLFSSTPGIDMPAMPGSANPPT